MDGLSLDDEIHISDVIAGSEGIEGAHLFRGSHAAVIWKRYK